MTVGFSVLLSDCVVGSACGDRWRNSLNEFNSFGFEQRNYVNLVLKTYISTQKSKG